MLRPLVSVIIPAHNSAEFLDRCIESILNQSEKNFEIIAVDDQSTDSTLELLKNFESREPNFRVFQTPHHSMAGGARNLGMSHRTGKYVSFIDSDDWIDTNYLHYMALSAEKTGADIVVCNVKREYQNAKDSQYRYLYKKSNNITGRYALSLLSRVIDQDISISSIPTNKIYRSEFLNKNDILFMENSRNEDDVFIFLSFLCATQVSIIGDTNYHLFQRKNSVSRSFSRKNFSDLMDAFYHLKIELEERHVFDEYCAYYYSFFEKCLGYVIESMSMAESDDKIINDYLIYAYNISRDKISAAEFIKYCGNKRIIQFFCE
jgi:glycosyltransferase involved in cell wall biosynthesis